MDVLSSIVMAFDSVEFRGPYVCDFEGDIITSTASSVWRIGGNLEKSRKIHGPQLSIGIMDFFWKYLEFLKLDASSSLNLHTVKKKQSYACICYLCSFTLQPLCTCVIDNFKHSPVTK
jgi:hypothetical protein